MSLTAGARLGPYEILSALGAGGMGEVYRARDPRLGRDVAIKILPAAFSAHADRLQRFEQEARAAATLNHPNILAVYDIGTEAGAPFIVSELLEGTTLRDRLNAGEVATRKALEWASQIVRGLAAAHEKGIAHRDLKPENVFITTDNRVKILDFGLAKLTQDHAALTMASALPTTPSPTEPGVVLGTVGYMAPEQVRGQPADHRADLFAFGAILYELVSGYRAFRRDTGADTMAAILNEEPSDLRSGPRPIPTALVRVVDRCLEKSPSARFQTASDLGFALDAVWDAPGVEQPLPPRARKTPWAALGWAVAALLLLALTPFVYQHLRERSVARQLMRFQIPPTIELSESGVVGLSPDGRLLAFMGLGSDRVLRLWIRALDSLDVRPLPGSEAAIGPPFAWSPDSRFIAFDTGGRIRKLDVSGGPPMTLCDVPGVAVGAAWNRDGDIIIGQAPGGLLRIRATGGAVSPLTVLDQSRKEDFHMMPSFLPDGRHFVYLRVSARSPETSGVYVGTLDAKPEQQNTERLMPYEVGVTYAPSTDPGPGRLLFVHEGTLMAQPFDAARRVLAGDRAALAERVGSFRDGGFFAVSDNDVLAYRTADTDFQLTWFDRQGAVVGRVSEPGRFRSLALSPDGTRVIVSRTDALDMAKADLWLLDLAHGGATRLTFGSGLAEYPIWSADGSRVFFTFNNENLYEKLASGEGSEERILRSPNSAGLLRASDWSRDGRFFVYSSAEASIKRRDIWVLPRDGKPVPFVRTEFDEEQGRFSPDGRWIAYVSNQSGASEVYVRAFTPEFGGGSAGAGGSFLVSRGGGSTPRWRADGKEIFYVGPDGKLMAVGVMPGQDFRMGSPLLLFQPPQGSIVGDASADGKRFLLATPVGASATAPFTVVLNWSVGLKK